MKKENIIFSNLYGKHDESIKGALKRGDWKNISKILKLDKQDIINKINSMFGYKAINKIKIQNGNFADDHKLNNKPIKEKKTDISYVKKIKEIKNDNLANALISIGNYINKWHIEFQTLGAIN